MMATDDGVADHRTVFCNEPDPLRDRQFKFTVPYLYEGSVSSGVLECWVDHSGIGCADRF